MFHPNKGGHLNLEAGKKYSDGPNKNVAWNRHGGWTISSKIIKRVIRNKLVARFFLKSSYIISTKTPPIFS